MPPSQVHRPVVDASTVTSAEPVRFYPGRRKIVAPRPPVIVWDTETTGFPPSAQIIEIALRQIYSDEQSAGADSKELALLINPGKRIRNTHIHGISNAMVQEKPDFKEAWRQVEDFVMNCVMDASGMKPILVAHNAKFDKAMLHCELKRIGREMPDWHFACSITHVCKIVWPARSSYKQDAMINMLGIKNEATHRALGDIRALAQLMYKADQHLAGVIRQSDAPILRDDSSQDLVTPTSGYYSRGDAITTLILQKLESVEKSQRSSPAPSTGSQRTGILVVTIANNGGYFCTRRGVVFHKQSNCDGLRKAIRVYEISGPPPDRRPCRLCGGNKISRTGQSALDQIETHLAASRNGRRDSSSNERRTSIAASPDTRTPSTVVKTSAAATQVTAEPVQAGGTKSTQRLHTTKKTSVTSVGMRESGKATVNAVTQVNVTQASIFYLPTGNVYHVSKVCRSLGKAVRINTSPVAPRGRRPCEVCSKDGSQGADSALGSRADVGSTKRNNSQPSRILEGSGVKPGAQGYGTNNTERKLPTAWMSPELQKSRARK